MDVTQLDAMHYEVIQVPIPQLEYQHRFTHRFQ